MSVFGSGDYDREKKVTVLCLAGCAVVSFLVLVIMTGKKKLQSSVRRVVLLCQFSVLAITTGKNKVTVICLASCAVVSVFDSGDYDRKKKVSVVCLAGCVTTGKKCSSRRQSNYDRKKKSSSRH